MTQLAAAPRPAPTADPTSVAVRRPAARWAGRVLLAATFAVYAWFYQGPGYNQNAHFATVRALVEDGTFEITRLNREATRAFYTGDFSVRDGRVYSNKPPGLPLLAAPVYAAAVAVERAAGWDPGSVAVARVNIYLLTLWTAAVPGALLVWLLHGRFRARGVEPGAALALSAAFAFGTQVLPYAGIMMLHVLVAACLFAAWRLIAEDGEGDGDGPPSRWRALGAGLLLGVAVVTDYLTTPILVLYAAVLVARRRAALLPWLAAGPVLAGAGLAWYQWAHFGSPLATTYTGVNPEYDPNPHLWLGHFDWPDPRKLWWLTVHPHRGLFYCSPVMLLPVLSLAAWLTSRRAGRATTGTAPRHDRGAIVGDVLLPLGIVAFLLLFNTMYDAWVGGWGVGSRFLIPGLAFAFTFAPRAYATYPRPSRVLMGVSVAFMLAVTAVRAQWPTNPYGPPSGADPVAQSIRELTFGAVAIDRGSFNLGLLAGLPGVASLVPPVLIIAGTFLLARRLRGAMGGDPPECGARNQ